MLYSVCLSVAERRGSQDNMSIMDLIMFHYDTLWHYDMPGVCYVTLHYSGLCRATCPLHCQITTATGSSPNRHCSLETGPAHHILRTTLQDYITTGIWGWVFVRMGGYHCIGRQCIMSLQCSPRLKNILWLRSQLYASLPHSLFPL